MSYFHYSNDCAEYHKLVLDGPRGRVLRDVHVEREAQDRKWGQQSHPDGTGQYGDKEFADMARSACDEAHRAGRGTWRDILWEELNEALAESEPAKLRAELIQVAAVAVNWIEAIDRREAGE